MKLKRLWHTGRMSLIRSGYKRADYARKHRVYAEIGDHVLVQGRLIPLYSELIKFHNNIVVGRKVEFVTHDVIHSVINHLEQEKCCTERIGCIEVMDNVFIGNGTIVMHGVKIGENTIIAAGSVVTKDTEPNSIYAGVPARRIGSFSEFVEKRKQQEADGAIATTRHNQNLTEQEINHAWEMFNNAHE